MTSREQQLEWQRRHNVRRKEHLALLERESLREVGLIVAPHTLQLASVEQFVVLFNRMADVNDGHHMGHVNGTMPMMYKPARTRVRREQTAC